MPATVYVINPANGNRSWVAAALAPAPYVVECVDGGAALFARLAAQPGACLVAFAEPDAGAALQLVREVRRRVPDLPIIVLGPHSAFRTAVDIARIPATDFLEMPASGRQLRQAIAKALKATAGRQQ